MKKESKRLIKRKITVYKDALRLCKQRRDRGFLFACDRIANDKDILFFNLKLGELRRQINGNRKL